MGIEPLQGLKQRSMRFDLCRIQTGLRRGEGRGREPHEDATAGVWVDTEVARTGAEVLRRPPFLVSVEGGASGIRWGLAAGYVRTRGAEGPGGFRADQLAKMESPSARWGRLQVGQLLVGVSGTQFRTLRSGCGQTPKWRR